jgi:hypothetical protein
MIRPGKAFGIVPLLSSPMLPCLKLNPALQSLLWDAERAQKFVEA